MKKSFNIFLSTFLISLGYTSTYAQVDSSSRKVLRSYSDELRFPYIGNYTPSFVATNVGYNFVQSQELEVGLLWNIGETRGFSTGAYVGPGVLYRRSIDRNLNAISASFGQYSGFSFGCEVNYNWNSQNAIWGVKPFVGVSIHLFQIIYGYNILNDERNKDIRLRNHSLSFKMVIPFYVPRGKSDNNEDIKVGYD